MKIIKIVVGEQLVPQEMTCACIGYFDGLHKGHMALINTTIEESKKHGCKSALITFMPDPWITIKDEEDIPHLTPFEKRCDMIFSKGIDIIYLLMFTKEMSEYSYTRFVKELLLQINLKTLVCGFDFHYGQYGKGDIHTLRNDASNHFDVIVIESVNENGQKISSTQICHFLSEGNIELVNTYLGYIFNTIGVVVQGRQKGRLIGFPTANIQHNKEQLLPKTGVYGCYITIDNKRYRTMVNVGHNPTFNYVSSKSVEAYIVDFNLDIYGKEVMLEWIFRLRDECKFNHIDELIEQLHRDKKTISERL